MMKAAATRVLGATMLLLLHGPVCALQFGAGAGVPQPTLLRITGFIGSAPEGVSTLGPVTLGLGNTVATLDVVDVQLLNGPLTEGRSALRHVELYTPNLRLVGAAAVLDGIRQAAPQAKITVFGYLNNGARRLIVVEVHAA